MVFIKHYDPRTSKLTLVSRLLLHPSTMLGRLADRLADRLHLPPDRTKVRGRKLEGLGLRRGPACNCHHEASAEASTASGHKSRVIPPVGHFHAVAGGGEGSASRVVGCAATERAAVQDAAPAWRHHRRARAAFPGAHAASCPAELSVDVQVDMQYCHTMCSAKGQRSTAACRTKHNRCSTPPSWITCRTSRIGVLPSSNG